MEFRTGYNYDTDSVSRETGLRCEDDSLAVQAEKDECDINTIVRRFGLTGKLPSNVRPPMYGDFTGISDYREAIEAINLADEAFYDMPADIRTRFQNDPGQFVDFCSNRDNLEEMRKMGLAVKPVADVPEVGTTSGTSDMPPAG